MKKLSIALLITISITGCRSGFSVVVKNDPFKGGETVIADMWHKVVDGNLDNTRALYSKEIKNGVTTVPELKLDFQATIGLFHQYFGEKLDRQLYLAAGDKSFKLNFNDTMYLKQNHNYSRSNTSVSDSGIKASSSSGSYESVVMSGSVKITPDIQKAILANNNFLIRVYAGKTATNLEATPAQLSALKKFLEVNASNYTEYKVKKK